MVAHQLNGDLEESLEVHEGLMSCMKSDGATPQEKAQTLLHVVRLCIESGDITDGMQRLEMGLREGVISARGEATQLKGKAFNRMALVCSCRLS